MVASTGYYTSAMPGLLSPASAPAAGGTSWWNNWVNPTPTGLTGLLAQQFDPKELRYQTGANALTQLGLGLLSPDPKAPNAWQSGITRGIAGAAQSTQDTQDRFYQRGMQNVQLNELQRTYNQRDQAKAEVDKLLPTLPPELQQAFGGFARTYPDEFLKTFADAKLKAQFNTNGLDRYGANGFWAQDKDGNYHIIQPDKQGGPGREMLVPDGMHIVPNTTYVDTPTSVIPQPSKGVAAPGGYAPIIPKDLAGAESEKKRGDVIADYRSMSSKMPGLQTVVSELNDLANKATYTSTGQVIDWTRKELGAQPREAAVARTNYISKVNNQILPMLRDTFGAQFTQVEGERLMATMGDPNLTPAEKQAVLQSFIEQKQRDVQALAVQGGLASSNAFTPGQTQQNTGGETHPVGQTATNPQTGEKIIWDGQSWRPAQ